MSNELAAMFSTAARVAIEQTDERFRLMKAG
jgi:hypothetical protein